MDEKPGPSKEPEGAAASCSDDVKTLKEFLALEENKGANYVVPLAWCPHLESNAKFEPESLSHVTLESPCQDCDHKGENWICLVCKEVKFHHFLQLSLINCYSF